MLIDKLLIILLSFYTNEWVAGQLEFDCSHKTDYWKKLPYLLSVCFRVGFCFVLLRIGAGIAYSTFHPLTVIPKGRFCGTLSVPAGKYTEAHSCFWSLSLLKYCCYNDKLFWDWRFFFPPWIFWYCFSQEQNKVILDFFCVCVWSVLHLKSWIYH